MTTMDIKELLNRTDRFAANAGCRITEVDERHAVAKDELDSVKWLPADVKVVETLKNNTL